MKYLVLAAAAALALSLPGAARAQQKCADHALLKISLFLHLGQVRQGAKMKRGKSLHELYANPRTGTWTALRLRANGTACIEAAGRDAPTANPTPKGDPT